MLNLIRMMRCGLSPSTQPFLTENSTLAKPYLGSFYQDSLITMWDDHSERRPRRTAESQTVKDDGENREITVKRLSATLVWPVRASELIEEILEDYDSALLQSMYEESDFNSPTQIPNYRKPVIGMLDSMDPLVGNFKSMALLVKENLNDIFSTSWSSKISMIRKFKGRYQIWFPAAMATTSSRLTDTTRELASNIYKYRSAGRAEGINEYDITRDLFASVELMLMENFIQLYQSLIYFDNNMVDKYVVIQMVAPARPSLDFKFEVPKENDKNVFSQYYTHLLSTEAGLLERPIRYKVSNDRVNTMIREAIERCNARSIQRVRELIREVNRVNMLDTENINVGMYSRQNPLSKKSEVEPTVVPTYSSACVSLARTGGSTDGQELFIRNSFAMTPNEAEERRIAPLVLLGIVLMGYLLQIASMFH